MTVGKTKSAMTFGDIGVNENVTYMGTTIQLLADNGATLYTDEYVDLGEVALTFTYVTTDMGAPSNGWYLQDDFAFEHPQNSRILPFGQGYLVDCGDAEAALVFAGSVSKEDTEVELGENFNFTGNCTPKDITFGDIAVNENVTYMGTTIQLLADNGATLYTDEYVDLGEVALTFTYVTTDMGAPSNGWYLQDDFAFEHPQNSRGLAAGAGILVDCGDADASITFPAAL